jgi:hypothetical protein
MESKLREIAAMQDQGVIDLIRSMKCRLLGTLALVESTTVSADIAVTGTVAYVIDGAYLTKATDAAVTPTTCVVQAASTRCRYLASINKAGSIKVTKGTEVGTVTTGAVTSVSVNAALKRITSTAAIFKSFVKGMKIRVAASAIVITGGFTNQENNGVFDIEAVDPSGKWISVRQNRFVDEAAGQSVTISTESDLPELPVAECPIGIIVVNNGSGGTFTMGTDDLTAVIVTANSGTVQFYNITDMPTGLLH